MVQLRKSQLKLARKIWRIQKKHRGKKFIARDFTRRGKLSRFGLAKIKRKRRRR